MKETSRKSPWNCTLRRLMAVVYFCGGEVGVRSISNMVRKLCFPKAILIRVLRMDWNGKTWGAKQGKAIHK